MIGACVDAPRAQPACREAGLTPFTVVSTEHVAGVPTTTSSDLALDVLGLRIDWRSGVDPPQR